MTNDPTWEKYADTLRITKVRAWFLRLLELQAKSYDEYMWLKSTASLEKAHEAHTKFIAIKHACDGFQAGVELFIGRDAVRELIASVNAELIDSGTVREYEI